MGEWIAKYTLGELMDRAAQSYGDREALFFKGKRWSFSQLKEQTDQAAKGLIRLGVKQGDKVTLWLVNRPEWIHIMFAVAKIGAVLVPINTRFRTADLEYVVRQSDSTTLITVDNSGPVSYLDMVQEICPELEKSPADDLRIKKLPGLRRVIILSDQHYRGTYRWTNVLEAGKVISDDQLIKRQQAVTPDDIALIMYTSGTTGFPKGVMHNHNIICNVIHRANRMGLTSRDVILMYLPLFHAFGLYEGPLMSLISGARQVLTEMFDPKEALDLIVAEKATIVHGFDTHFHDIMSHPDFLKTDRSSLRTGLLAAGLASSEPIARRAQKLLCRTMTGWGMSEVGVGATMSFLDSSEDDRCLASGFPVPSYELKVIDPATGEKMPPGTPGELCCRGPLVMQGYYKKPEETAKTIDPEGWLHSGDMATMRDDGCVRFLGRYKDMLKVGGENVDPAEVEAFLLSHPDVHQAVVVGKPDKRLSEVSVAYVALKEGVHLEEEELKGFCKGKLASFKIPKHIVFIKEYPMTSSGKVQKFKLREEAINKLGNE